MAANAFKEHEEAKIQQLLADAACAPTRANIKPQKPKAFLYETRRRYDEREVAILNEAQKIVESEDHKWMAYGPILVALRDAGHIDINNEACDPGAAFDWLKQSKLIDARHDDRKGFIFACRKYSLLEAVKGHTKIDEAVSLEALNVDAAELIQRLAEFKKTPPFSFANKDGKVCLLSEGFDEGNEKKVFYREHPSEACVWRELLWAFEGLNGKRQLDSKQTEKIWKQFCKLLPYLNDLGKPLDEFHQTAFTARAHVADPSARFISTVLRYRQEIDLTLWALCNNEVETLKSQPRFSIGRKALGFLIYLIWKMYAQIKVAKPDSHYRTRVEILCIKQFFETRFPGVKIYLNHVDNRHPDNVDDDRVKGVEFKQFCLDVLQAADDLSVRETTREEKAQLLSNDSIWRSGDKDLSDLPPALLTRLGLDEGEPCAYGIRGFYDDIPYLRIA